MDQDNRWRIHAPATYRAGCAGRRLGPVTSGSTRSAMIGAVPEGHTIHRLARDQRADLSGRTVRASSPQGRFAAGADRIDGATPLRIEAYGKHLFHHYDFGESLHVHLGLIGRFDRGPVPPAEPVGEVRLRLEGAEHSWDLRGPMICALLSPEQVDAVTARLGPDPLRRGASATTFAERVLASDRPIAALLLDQWVIAGIGNVFRAEMLFLTGIHPAKPGRSLQPQQVEELWELARSLLRAGVRRNRIVTVHPDELDQPVSRTTRVNGTYVYHQQACRRCGSTIQQLEIAGRRIDHCPRCQPAVG